MKKVVFSAIAMIAFVGSSRANTIADKEISIQKNGEPLSNEYIQSSLLEYNCDLVKFRIYNIAISNGHTPARATSLSFEAYFNCVSKNLALN